LRNDPGFGPLVRANPSFGVALAEKYVQAELQGYREPTEFEIARTMAAYNIPQSSLPGLFGGGRGGRSAEQIANEVRNYSTTILNRSRTLGMGLKPEEITYIATVAQKQNYTLEQIDEALRGLINWDDLGAGTLVSNKESLLATAKQYFISLPTETLTDWATRIATGQGTEEGFNSVIREQAKLANPWMTDYIDRGLSPSELLAPSRRTIANSLGIDEATVDFSDPSFMSLVTVKDDKGSTRLATLSELRSNIRQDARWESSDEARQTAASMARLVAQVFGRSAF
jgi:hypothetical protein